MGWSLSSTIAREIPKWGLCGRDRMVVGFTTTREISVIKCVNDCGESMVSSTNKTDCHGITEILLKVALNTINQTNHECTSS